MYCSHCGAEIQTDHKFCNACGKALAPGLVASAPERSRLQNHLQLVGVLWIAYAALITLASVAVLLAGNVILTNIRLPMEARFVPMLVSLAGWCLLIAAAGGIASGWGLLQRAPWARLLAIVLAFLALFNVPLGTALGIYTLWVLLPEEAAREYDRLAAGA